VNAVTEAEGSPAAVLIRAVDPLEGIDLMGRRRGVSRADLADGARRAGLCRGPGNLTVALGITLANNRADLTQGPLRIEDQGRVPASIEWTPRIGINVGVERLWRCVWAGHPAATNGRRAFRPPVTPAG
jgi:DNA-3-methyladenine glycosylase